jgi:glycosyltransferase involved in cell wall biosynthesis
VAVRVLWLTKGLGPGGAERLLVEMARTLDRGRVDVTAAYVLPWKDHLAGELELAGVRAVCLSQTRRDPRWLWRLRRLLADAEFDLVHAHSPVPAVAARLAGLTLPRRRRPVIVTTEHNTWTSHHPVTRWANQLTGRRDAATFAVTVEARSTIRGAAAGRAQVLVHGIDVAGTASRPPGERQRIRAELGLGDDEVVIGTVANFRAQKDYPNLFSAAARLVEREIPFRLVAVGQGQLEAEIIGQRDELGLDDHVILAGFRPDAVAVMAACDIFVLASAWEGLPVAVMEALALALPIVATEVGGVAEALDESNAILVPPRDPEALADALVRLVQDPARRTELSAGARTAAARFDISRATETMTSTYERVCSPTTPEPAAAAQTRRTRPSPAEIRAATEDDRAAIIRLLGASLGWEGDARYDALYAWKHETNPFGPSPAWVVEDGGEVVAVRLFMRWEFVRGGRRLRAVRAVDTATHPSQQGKGLFTALTLHASEACRAEGVDFVFNTPNEQSRPGYLKMGWRQVGRLPAAMRPRSPGELATVVRSRTPAERWSLPLDRGVGRAVEDWLADGRWGDLHDARPVSSTDRTIRTSTSPEFVRWRFGLPDLHYRVLEGDGAAIIIRLRRRGPGTELVVAERLGDPRRADLLAADALRSTDASHALRLGGPDLRAGFVPLPGGGPILTWRAVCDHGEPPLPNWDLQLRDIELF